MDAMKIYNILPIWGQNFACYCEGARIAKYRYGKKFWKYLSEYEKRNTWTYEQLCEFRDKRLCKMVNHCYNTVPYYKELFNDMGLNPESIKYLDDLKKLPILTKETINLNPKKFLSVLYSESKMQTQHTSGTSGAGFVFKTTNEAICEQWAVWWRYRRNLGIEFGTLCGLFGGRSIVPISQKKPPFYRINKLGNQIYFSAYHMSDINMKEYIAALNDFKPLWLHGYPSSLALLAQYLFENKIQLNYSVKWITTGAENLLQQQKEIIKTAFGVEPYQHYGMAEGVANASENLYHQYIIDEDYAAIELIFDEKIRASRIIGTSLTNFAMPLLRYEVGDIAMVDEMQSRKILTIDGRKEDYLILNNGTKIGRLDHIFKDMVNVREAQIKQDAMGNIAFFVVKGANYSTSDEACLKKEIEERLGKEKYTICYKDRIERTKSGKIRFVVSERMV